VERIRYREDLGTRVLEITADVVFDDGDIIVVVDTATDWKYPIKYTQIIARQEV
jgi:hypothetical protein